MQLLMRDRPHQRLVRRTLLDDGRARPDPVDQPGEFRLHRGKVNGGRMFEGACHWFDLEFIASRRRLFARKEHGTQR